MIVRRDGGLLNIFVDGLPSFVIVREVICIIFILGRGMPHQTLAERNAVCNLMGQ